MVKITSILLFALIIVSCKHTSPELADTSDPCADHVINYETEIQPILNASCAFSGCHDATTAADGVDLSDYANTMTTGEIEAGKPKKSELYETIIATDDDIMPPSPYPALSQDKIDLIYQWINQGAQNLICETSTCDTSGTVTFSGHVASIISTNCEGCHNATTSFGNVSLETYDQIKTIADNGALMHSLLATGGYSIMPTSGPLSDCEIAKIQKWVDNGAQND